ncbi:hypothetical protein HPB50_000115 [Hyalomma asiaticum]|uniref:Uncharacterized protein n=1 Tax=Hyalomma asiaticum TaxID=266040 RepID=A0ACB7TCH4_HYAAI|nr:hypothetical protein HPB50_000115 [Hyalomma asiaticum]
MRPQITDIDKLLEKPRDLETQSLSSKDARARGYGLMRLPSHLHGLWVALEEQVLEKCLIEAGSLWFMQMLHASEEL